MKMKRKSDSKTLAKGKKRKGPHLPNSILKTIANEKRPLNSDDEIHSDDDNGGGDLYEYEEGVPEEESRKNNRYDRVDNFEFELPEDFKDENVESEDDDDDGENTDSDEKAERHTRMLQSLTGMPSAAFEGESKRKTVLVTEAYPESEFNPTRDVLEGKNLVTFEDLLLPLEGEPGYQQLRKGISKFQRGDQSVVHAPLPKPERERVERKAVRKLVDKEFSKWLPQVKRNREAPTVYFNNQDADVGYSTVGAIASEFQPRTEFEKKMASVLDDNKVWEAHQEDGARLLELNEVSMEDHIKNRDHIAKMRSLLFRHEVKFKRIKKIKSKTYHRLKNKDLKSAVDTLLDPKVAKEEAMRQETKRAEERMTLKHKNTGKWAKRMISRGLNVKYDGTRAAISEQLQINEDLSRKRNSMNDGSSSDESDDEDELNDGSDQDTPSKLLAQAKENTLKIVEDDEVPNSGLLSLPFMARAMKKKNEEAIEEAKRALEEYEELENSAGAENSENPATVSGRKTFGATAKVEAPKKSKKESDNFYDNNSDSDNDMDGIEDNDLEAVRDNNASSPARNIETITDTEKFEDVVGNPASKTTFDVALYASGSWKKMKGCENTESKKASKPHVPVSQAQDIKKPIQESREEESDDDSESDAEQMVDGILTSASNETFEVPSQAELINRAFAGDDVVDEFEKEKQEVLNQEVPEPEKPVQVPGWGQWTNIQNKRGLPKWMVREHEEAKKKREQALKTRKDARFKHVIISEKVDKRAEKLHTKTLPFPYTSQEVFEHSMRMPIGPEFNPTTIVGELNRPEVVKKAGVIIKPVKFEEVDPNEKGDDENPRSHQKQRPKKKGSNKTNKGKSKVKSK
uniref:U3 small nucleolar RNA-associated protein 14 n=1 Tax=Noccaea caerulescens TaxID=107243 RepID=A0A1J3J0L4_NOCCA